MSPKLLSVKWLLAASLLLLLLAAGVLLVSAHSVQAQANQIFDPDAYLSGADLPTEDLRVIVVRFIRIGLGLIGLVFLAFILYGGFLWMTAGGNTDRVATAKRIILNAAIGLVIIFMALAIVTFVFNILTGASGPGGGGPNTCTEGEISGCNRCTGGRWQRDPALCPLTGSEFRIKDIETAHSGTDPAQNVFLCSSVQALFNNNIDASTVTASRVSLTTSNVNVPGTLDTRRRSVEFIPDSNLLPTTPYTMHYSNALADTSGLFLSSCAPFGCSVSGNEFVWNFTTGTEVDGSAPAIVSSNPIFDPLNPLYPDRNVSRAETIRVTFSEAIRLSTIDDGNGHPIASNIIIEQLANQGVSESPPIILDSTLFEIIPRSQGFDLRLIDPNLYEPFTWYQVTVQNVEDLCGNAMSAPVIWEFQTNDRAPGVGGYYPRGTNVCPDVGTLSVTFNTSMFEDAVSIAVSEEAASNPPIFSGILRASNLSPGPYQVPGVGGTWLVDPNSGFRAFNFTLSSSLQTNTQYFVAISTDRIINTAGEPLTYDWDFTVTDTGSCACSPYISSVNPASGFLGQCVTVKGQCFQGAVPNDPSDPRYATVTSLTFNLAGQTGGVPATIGGSGKNFVTTSIPAGFSEGDFILPQVTIEYNDPRLGSLTTNNTNVDYFVASSQLASGPCLLSISPGAACFGRNLSLAGLRFGQDPPGGRSTAQDNVKFANGLVQVPESQVTAWDDTRIRADVPSGASDGDVTVTASGLTSNSVPFDLACGVGASCSSDPNQCRPDNSLCAAGLSCNTSCICESPEPPGTPRVVSKSPTCSLSCTNEEISAVFSLAMNAATISDSTIDVRPCSPDCSLNNLGPEISYASIDYDAALQQVNISPSQALAAGTSYRVILYDTLESEVGITLGGLNFDRSGNGQKDSHSWTFGTKTEACALSGVTIEPVTATADRLNQRISYNSYAQGSNSSCSTSNINRWLEPWGWDSLQTAVATISTDDSNGDGLIDPRQTATVAGEGTTVIRASSGGFFADGNLSVNIITCDETTDCTNGGTQCLGSVCQGGFCTPVIEALSPAVGPFGRWTTISGCYFGSRQGSGSVDFGGVTANFPACGSGVWSNTQILVEVPDLPGGDHNIIVNTNRGQSSNTASFTVTGECLPGTPVPPSGVPGLCRLRPSAGAIRQSVRLEGEHFGASQANPSLDQVTFAGLTAREVAQVNNWTDTTIDVIVPDLAADGLVIAAVNACPSNGLDFDVQGGIGSSCDGNEQAQACQVNHSLCGKGTGLFCDPNSACTCQAAPAPSVLFAEPSGPDICRNATIEVTFDQLMNRSSLSGNVLLEVNNGSQPCASSLFLGDVDGDGAITAFDAQLAEAAGLGQPLPPPAQQRVNEGCGDVNKDGLTDTADGDEILKFEAGLPTSFPIGQELCPASLTFGASQTESGLARLTKSIASFFARLLSPVRAQPGNWCPVTTRLSSVSLDANGDGELTPLEDQTVARLSAGLLEANTNYRTRALTGAESTFGIPLATEFTQTFTTGDIICQIDHIDVLIQPPRAIQTTDTFLCAGRDDCLDDQDTVLAGNQHEWAAQAYDASRPPRPLAAQYQWTESDPEELFELTSLTTNDTFITALGGNGRATMTVKADDSANPSVGSATTNVVVYAEVCENPWPSRTQGFPFEDTQAPATGFSFFYCRDRGSAKVCTDSNLVPSCTLGSLCNVSGGCSCNVAGQFVCLVPDQEQSCYASCSSAEDCVASGQVCRLDQRDDLPALQLAEQDRSGAPGNVIKEFLLLRELGALSDDAIALRVVANPDHLNPQTWYDRNVPNPGSPSSILVDGYEAVRDGRTVYVNAANAASLANSQFYTNIYLMSYNTNAESDTVAIFNQLLDNWSFTISLLDFNICSGNAAQFCSTDEDCIATGAGTCQSDASKIRRDTKRVSDLGAIAETLRRYRGSCSNDVDRGCVDDSDCLAGGICQVKNPNFPLLEAGTFIAGESTSKWPSWGETLAQALEVNNLPVDPLNRFSQCPLNPNDPNAANFDPASCWDETRKVFECAPGSHLYLYSVDATPIQLPVTGPNVLANSGFEAGLSSWNLSPAYSNGDISDGEVSSTNEQVHTASQSLKVDLGINSHAIWSGPLTPQAEQLALAGWFYNLTGDVRLWAVWNFVADGDNLFPGCIGGANAGQPCPAANCSAGGGICGWGAAGIGGFNAGANWTQLSGNITVPDTALEVHITVGVDDPPHSTSVMYADDLEARWITSSGSVSSSANLFANMEYKNVDWLGTQTLNVGPGNDCRSFPLVP